MQVQLPIFILCLLIHAGIYQTSPRQERLKPLVLGLLVMAGTWVAWYAGIYLGRQKGQESMLMSMLGFVLINAPYYIPFTSFLVYLKR